MGFILAAPNILQKMYDYIGRNNPKFSYTLGHEILSDTGLACKDLGVYVSSNLSSSIHCTNISAKASKISAMIRRSFVSKNIDLMVLAFKTYVRPILEYCSVVWNPYHISDINTVEKVQRQFTKKILWRHNLSYNQRLEFLKLERLELRRIHTDITLAYNIICNEFLPFNDFYTLAAYNRNRSCNNQRLYINKFRLDCRKFDFCNRSARIWNSLPQHILN